MRTGIYMVLLLTVLCAAPRVSTALTPPVARDICRINGVVSELREVAQSVPWHSENTETVTEIAIEIRKAELLEKRTQQDSSHCVMYDYGQVEWFKLCDTASLEKGMRISASEGTTIGAGRYCIFDIEILGD